MEFDFMSTLFDMNVAELAGYSFDCACGKQHSVGINKIIIGSGKSQQVSQLIEEYKDKPICVVADEITNSILADKITATLTADGYKVNRFVFKPNGTLIPNESAIGRLVVEIDRSTSLIIAVGSGTINDICREISFKMQIPYMIVCTAPSMDGYSSVVSPLIVDNYKKTFNAVYPWAIVADTDIMREAPLIMIQAGIGDILGKYTALTDWFLAKEVENEYYCPEVAEFMRRAVNKCANSLEAIVNRDESAILNLVEALILSGIAIGMVGNSCPASGAEHHFSHYWEIDAIQNHREHALHGNSVGLGCIISSYIYSFMEDKLPDNCKPPKPQDMETLLSRAGMITNPKEFGISRELFHRSIIHAREVRPRFTILQFAAQYGCLEKFADDLTEKYYGSCTHP